MNSPFFRLLKCLHQSDVSFVLIGDFAAAAYGYNPTTLVIDICCDFSPANLMRLRKALDSLHPVHRMTPNRKPLELTENNITGLKNLYLETDLGILDCLGYVDGIGDYNLVLQNSRPIEIDGIEFKILTIDALILAKQSLNRPRDQQAVVQLKSIRQILKDKP